MQERGAKNGVGKNSLSPIRRPLTFFRIFPRMWHCRAFPSKQYASNRPLPSIRNTLPYSAEANTKKKWRKVDG